MLNGYSQWINIRGKNVYIYIKNINNIIVIVLVSVILAYGDRKKEIPLNKY